MIVTSGRCFKVLQSCPVNPITDSKVKKRKNHTCPRNPSLSSFLSSSITKRDERPSCTCLYQDIDSPSWISKKCCYMQVALENLISVTISLLFERTFFCERCFWVKVLPFFRGRQARAVKSTWGQPGHFSASWAVRGIMEYPKLSSLLGAQTMINYFRAIRVQWVRIEKIWKRQVPWHLKYSQHSALSTE